MKKLCMCLMLLVCTSSFGQNLVNNWSFEDTVFCPVGLGDITMSTGWNSYRETPDYFNSCNTDTNGTNFVGVPNNFFGHQYALTGEAFAGFYVYYKNSVTSNNREFLGSQLNQPLIIGDKYFISFFVCRSYSKILPYINGACNKIGVRFSTIPYSYNNPSPIDNFAHVYSDSIISDTAIWVRISGSFIADSSYQYMGIGNFFNDSATTYVAYDSISFASYYYIEDIKVSKDSAFVNTGIKIYSNNSIKAFPNPARDWIVLEGKGIKSVEILNALGSEIGFYPTTAFTLLNQINFGKLSCGVYFLKINMIDHTFHFQKIIVQ